MRNAVGRLLFTVGLVLALAGVARAQALVPCEAGSSASRSTGSWTATASSCYAGFPSAGSGAWVDEVLAALEKARKVTQADRN